MPIVRDLTELIGEGNEDVYALVDRVSKILQIKYSGSREKHFPEALHILATYLDGDYFVRVAAANGKCNDKVKEHITMITNKQAYKLGDWFKAQDYIAEHLESSGGQGVQFQDD